MKNVFVIFVLVFVGCLSTHAQIVTPGLLASGNFISLEQVREESKKKKGFFRSIDGFYSELGDFLKKAEFLKIHVPIVFKIDVDSATNLVYLDSLSIKNSILWGWYLSRKNIDKMVHILEESVEKDTCVFWNDYVSWEQLGFFWGRNIHYERWISYKPPYFYNFEVKELPKVPAGMIILEIFLFACLYLVITGIRNLLKLKVK